MDFGGIEGADVRCQAAADSAGLEGTFLAWLSAGSTAQVVDRFSLDGGPFVLVDGTVLAEDWEDLTDGSVMTPILMDASGLTYAPTALPEQYVITHTHQDGTSMGGLQPCGGFTADSAIEAGWGNAGASDESWTVSGDRWQCDSASGGGPSLYCFEQ